MMELFIPKKIDTLLLPQRGVMSSMELLKKGIIVARGFGSKLGEAFQKYGSSDAELGVTSKMYCLFGALGEEKISGKRILDLAGGSRFNTETITARSMEPWTARLFHEFGGQVTVIDIAPQVDEKFESHTRDLTKKGALDFLGSCDYDVVVCNLFANFTGKGEGAQQVWSPAIRNLGYEQQDEIKSELLAQITRVMKEGGIFFTDYDFRDYAVCIKENGRLRMFSPDNKIIQN